MKAEKILQSIYSPHKWRVFKALAAHDGISVKDLFMELRMAQSHVSQILGEMHRAGLVEFELGQNRNEGHIHIYRVSPFAFKVVEAINKFCK